MRNVFCLLTLLGFIAGCGSETKNTTTKPTESRDQAKKTDKDAPAVKGPEEKISADDLAKKFVDNAQAAKEKYFPKGEEGVTKEGIILEVEGEVKKTLGKDIYLKNGSNLDVVLRSKTSVAAAPGKAAMGRGYLNSFDGNSIIIRCEAVTVKDAGK